MTKAEQIDRALQGAEDNILGNRYVALEIDGDLYTAAATTASFHGQGNQHYRRIDYKKNGKKIARKNIDV